MQHYDFLTPLVWCTIMSRFAHIIYCNGPVGFYECRSDAARTHDFLLYHQIYINVLYIILLSSVLHQSTCKSSIG